MGLFAQQRGQPRYDGRLNNLQVSQSVYGTTVPILVGTCRVPLKLLWYGGFYSVVAPTSGGKGLFGGKGQQEYEYYANVVGMLAQGPCVVLLNVWDQQGKLQNLSSTYNYTIPSGGGAVSPVQPGEPNIQQDLGVTQAQSYSVVANDYGAGGPQTLTGTQQVPMKAVSGTPSTGEYSYDSATNTYSFAAGDAGTTVAISYSSVFSLYYYTETQAGDIPNTTPWSISTDNSSYFYSDQGVNFVDDGTALTVEPYGTTLSTGQYSVHDGNYYFAAADAGRYVYIHYTYTSSDPNLTSTSYLNLTFFNGAQGQTPWSFLTSNFPSAAFGYSSLCYVGANPMALGESAVLPNYNFEVLGQAAFSGSYDADLTEAIDLILTNPLCGVNFPSANIGDWSLAQAYWRSNGYNISQALQTTEPAASLIGRWIDAGNTAAVWSEGLLKLIPYGDTTIVGNGFTYTPPTNPAVTLTWDNFLPLNKSGFDGENTTDDPLQIQRKMPQDRYNYVQLQWTNRANDYNNELTTEMNDAFIQAYGVRIESPQTWEFLNTQAAATWALNLRLKRFLYIANTYKFKLQFTFAYLEPMDMIVLPTGEAVRALEIDEETDGSLTITAENFDYGSADVTIYPKQVSDSYQPNLSQSIPGNTVPIFIQNTTTQSNGILNKLEIGAVGQTPNWGGCNVYVSLDNTTYTQIGTINSKGIMGLLTANLSSGPDPDTTDALSVDISLSLLSNTDAELVSVTQQSADTFVTLCAIIDQSGLTNELLSYETAALTAQGRYSLSYLRRGVYATPVAAHTTGANFAFLGPNYVFLTYQYWPQYINQTLYVKLQSFNLMGGQVQSLSQCKAWDLFVGTQGSSFESPTVLRPATYTISTGPYGSVSNPTEAYDLNFSTFATIDSGFGSLTGTATVTYSAFGSGVIASPLSLYMNFQVPFVAGQDINISISFDGGATFPFAYNSIGAIGQSYATALPVPAGTDLSRIVVSASAISAISRSSILYLYELWIQ